ncbi:MAG TPA: HAP2/GCS1 family protein [Macellibacteroides fermentans]|nr:HAP2/GCS1 family protein [Macellibacteroides fermentans]
MGLIFSLTFSFAFSSLISSSQYESCLGKDVANCTDKLLITLSLENSQMNGTESILAVVNSATSPIQPYQLQKPLKIFVQKSPVIAKYDIVYRQDFNFRPYETVDETNIFTCKDGDYDSSPNCGWQYDVSGNKIDNSQGYCCNCEFWEIIGLSNSQHNRAKNCGGLNFGEGSSSAHCLRFHDLWYSAYEIMRNELYYEINIWIYEEGNDNPVSSFLLSPGDPIASDTALGCVVKLIGDYYPSQPAPELNHLFLFVPTRPSTHIMVQEGSPNWMLVNPSEMSMTGMECNKIGTSYYAFNTQSDKCTQVVGSCLNNQLYDLYTNDIEKIKAGKSPQYLLSARVILLITFS